MIRNDMMHLEEVLIGTLISKREYRELIFNTLDATYFNYLRPIYLEACKQHVDGVVFNEDTLVAKMEGMNVGGNRIMQAVALPMVNRGFRCPANTSACRLSRRKKIRQA